MISTQYYDSTDTICAISTPPGAGGVAIARVSGGDTFDIVSKIWRGKKIADMQSHTAHLGTIYDPATNEDLDQVLLTIFRGPRSFTGDDVAEIAVHGSRWIQGRLIDILTSAGARLALPGEYTRRAFAAGKMDLAEAEAVADLIASSSAAAHRIAINQMRGGFSKHIEELRAKLLELASLLELELDFSEEDVEFASRERLYTLATETAEKLERLESGFKTGAAIKDGVPVAIIGHTNVGKSSLLNALLNDERAIVSDIHGTTRDIVEDTVEIGPYLIRFKDTAGIRHSDDPIEQMGINRSRHAADSAQLILCVVDASQNFEVPTEIESVSPERIIFILNKADLCTTNPTLLANIAEKYTGACSIAISAKQLQGIDELRKLISSKIQEIQGAESESDIIITNARHAIAIGAAAADLRLVAQGITTQLPSDLIAQDLRQALHHLSSITGAITTPEILSSIFENFCIGK